MKTLFKTLLAIVTYLALLCTLEASPISDIHPESAAAQQILATISKGDDFSESSFYLQAAEHYVEALNALSQLQDSENSDHRYFLTSYTMYQLGDAYIKANNSVLAIPILETLIAQTSDNPAQQQLHYDAIYLLALAHKSIKNDATAKTNLSRYLNETPQSMRTYASNALFQLGLIHFQEGNVNEAARLWKPNEESHKNGELDYLKGVMASEVLTTLTTENRLTSPYYILAVESLTKAADSPKSKSADQALSQLGALYYQLGKFADAEQIYLRLSNEHPHSELCAEGWFWSAQCAEKLHKETLTKERKQRVWEKFPNSSYAPEAYLSMYTTAEYIQGDRGTIKHLQNFIGKFPSSPLLIEAHYLLGMDLKRDRKTAEGKWIRKKNLTDAIDAFQKSENEFSIRFEKGEIPQHQLPFYIKVRYQAALEKALANLAIANDSLGAKKKIYLDYAEEAFKTLKAELEDPANPYTQILQQGNIISPLYEESLFGLAQTYIKKGRDLEANTLLSSLLQTYQQAQITKSYYLSRMWYEMGMIALRKKEALLALQYLKNSEDTSKGGFLSTDQRLDLWIQQALCYRALGNYDQALLILSKTVNDDAVSALRLKAMYLRAETYEQSGKPELARKQLESLAKKGGYWGKESKHKLEVTYEH